jgi:hypothetical protein
VLEKLGGGGYGAIACGYLGLSRPEEGKTILEASLPSNPDHSSLDHGLFLVYSALSDESAAGKQIQWGSGKVEAAVILGTAAAKPAAQGKMQKARAISSEPIRMLWSSNFKDSAAGFAGAVALMEAHTGNFAEAKKSAAASLSMSRTRTNLPAVAVALAFAGDFTQARDIVGELSKRFR